MGDDEKQRFWDVNGGGDHYCQQQQRFMEFDILKKLRLFFLNFCFLKYFWHKSHQKQIVMPNVLTKY